MVKVTGYGHRKHQKPSLLILEVNKVVVEVAEPVKVIALLPTVKVVEVLLALVVVVVEVVGPVKAIAQLPAVKVVEVFLALLPAVRVV